MMWKSKQRHKQIAKLPNQYRIEAIKRIFNNWAFSIRTTKQTQKNLKRPFAWAEQTTLYLYCIFKQMLIKQRTAKSAIFAFVVKASRTLFVLILLFSSAKCVIFFLLNRGGCLFTKRGHYEQLHCKNENQMNYPLIHPTQPPWSRTPSKNREESGSEVVFGWSGDLENFCIHTNASRFISTAMIYFEHWTWWVWGVK